MLLCLSPALAAEGGDDIQSLTITGERWNLTLSGGKSRIDDVETSMQTAPADLRIHVQGAIAELNFPGRSFTTTDFDDGYAIQMLLTRQLGAWLGVGLQAGASFKQKHTVETGQIPFLSFDALGNLVSAEIIGYTIDYRTFMYHAVPTVVLGRYFPLGNFAWKPYISGGGGIHQIHERIVLRSAGTDFDLGKRYSTAVGVSAAGGVDFRWSPASSMGVQYQIQRVFTSGHLWAFALPTLRFSYLF